MTGGFLPGLAAVIVFVASGIYAAAVLDGLAGRLVAGRRAGGRELLSALALPFREAALLALQQPGRTERPDLPARRLAPALLGGLAAVAAGTVPLASAPLGGLGAVAGARSGIVLFGAAMALVMVCVFLHGWSANSVPPLVGGYRFVAQALSFEMPLALVLIAAALPAESLSFAEMVRSQTGALTAQTGLWNVVRQPLGLPLYLVAAAGVSFQGPLRLPDATDLAGGTRAESSGTELLAWRLARGAVLVAVSAVGATVFLGGWSGPLLPGPAWVAVKTLALLALLVAAGHLLARLRLERFVVVSWAVLIPLALLDVFVSGIFLL